MQKLFALLGLVVIVASAPVAFSSEQMSVEQFREFSAVIATSPAALVDVINWKVGDTATYSLSMDGGAGGAGGLPGLPGGQNGGLPNIPGLPGGGQGGGLPGLPGAPAAPGAGQGGAMGSQVKSVTQDTGPAVWLKEVTVFGSQTDTAEILLNKLDAKILKFIHNGQEEAVPNTKITLISQDYTTITVPAGTFKCMHIVAKDDQSHNMEIWANPKDTVMDGALKEKIDTGIMPIVLELTSFKKI